MSSIRATPTPLQLEQTFAAWGTGPATHELDGPPQRACLHESCPGTTRLATCVLHFAEVVGRTALSRRRPSGHRLGRPRRSAPAGTSRSRSSAHPRGARPARFDSLRRPSVRGGRARAVQPSERCAAAWTRRRPAWADRIQDDAARHGQTTEAGGFRCRVRTRVKTVRCCLRHGAHPGELLKACSSVVPRKIGPDWQHERLPKKVRARACFRVDDAVVRLAPTRPRRCFGRPTSSEGRPARSCTQMLLRSRLTITIVLGIVISPTGQTVHAYPTVRARLQIVRRREISASTRA